MRRACIVASLLIGCTRAGFAPKPAGDGFVAEQPLVIGDGARADGARDGGAPDGARDGGAPDGDELPIPATAPLQQSAFVLTTSINSGSGARDVAVDAAGRGYVVGRFEGRTELPDGTPAQAAGVDGLLIALDEQGAMRWARILTGGTGLETISHVAVSRDGRVLVVAGQYMGEPAFAGLPFPAPTAGARAFFVVLLDPETGDALWMDRCDGELEELSTDLPRALDVDDAGKVALVVGFKGTMFSCASFGTHSAQLLGDASTLVRYQCDAALGSCDAVGTPIDLPAVNTPTFALAIGQEQRLHLATRERLSAIDWQSGSELRSRDFYSTGRSVTNIALRARGGRLALAAQYSSQSPDFGAGPLEGHDVAVALYEGKTGDAIFVRGLGSWESPFIYPLDVDVDSEGTLVAMGKYADTLDIGTLNELPIPYAAYLVAVEDATSSPRWSMLIQDQLGGGGIPILSSMAYGGGRFIVAGSLEHGGTFAGELLVSGAEPAFMALSLAP